MQIAFYTNAVFCLIVLIRCVCKKSLFVIFVLFPWLLKKNMQNQKQNLSGKFAKPCPPPPPPPPLLPLYMCCNIHHFGIAQRKVMGIKNYKLRPQNYKFTPTKLQVTLAKTTSYAHKNYKLRSQKLQVTSHKTTSYAFKTSSYVHKTTSYAFKNFKF